MAKRSSAIYFFRICVAVMIFIAGLLMSCGDRDTRARSELRELETHLDAISVESDPDWKARLNATAALAVETPEIKKIQGMCVSAYREYSGAMAEMATANLQLKELEAALRQGKIDGIEDKHRKTRKAIDETTRHLEQSQLLIQACMTARHEIRGRLKVVRN